MQERADRAFQSAEGNGPLQVLRSQDPAEQVDIEQTQVALQVDFLAFLQ